MSELFNHPEARRLAVTVEIERLRDQTITQAFVAGQMDAQYTATAGGCDDLLCPHCHPTTGTRHEVESPLKRLKAKAYALAQDSIDALIILVRQEATGKRLTMDDLRGAQRRYDFAAGMAARIVRDGPLYLPDKGTWVFDAMPPDGIVDAAFAAHLKQEP